MKKLVLVLICAILLISCSKDKIENEMEGAFSGKFTATYPESVVKGTLTLELKNGKYFIFGLLHNQSEFSGDYSINENKIIFDVKVWKTDFVDENGFTIAYNFDTFIVPQDEYYYTFNGSKLKFSKKYDEYNRKYEWEFTKKCN